MSSRIFDVHCARFLHVHGDFFLPRTMRAYPHIDARICSLASASLPVNGVRVSTNVGDSGQCETYPMQVCVLL